MDRETAMDMEDMGEATEVITDEDIIKQSFRLRNDGVGVS